MSDDLVLVLMFAVMFSFILGFFAIGLKVEKMEDEKEERKIRAREREIKAIAMQKALDEGNYQDVLDSQQEPSNIRIFSSTRIREINVNSNDNNDEKMEEAVETNVEAIESAKIYNNEIVGEYFSVIEGTDLENSLQSTNEIIKALDIEDDENKDKIESFFNRYLPLAIENIQASKKSNVKIDETLEMFSDTVLAFSKSLYNADDLIEVNNIVMKQLAQRDGYLIESRNEKTIG